MASWKILISDGLDESGLAILRKQADVVDQTGITADELLQVIGGYDAVIVRGRTKVTPAVFTAAGKLKVVGRAGVGVDNIDLNAAKEHRVTVVNAPVSTTIAVAELTLGLMLAMVREIPRADHSMKSGKWLKKEFEGMELYQKTLGVIGVGRIGSNVASRAAAFGMTVLGYDRFMTNEQIVNNGLKPVPFEEILGSSDVLTLHVPLSSETRGLISTEAFRQMKPGVCLICTARGGVIDETALLAALDAGLVASAALDVFSTEPPGLTPLVGHPRVVVTPHIGAQTVEAQQRASKDISTEVLAALKAEPLRWKVA
jgi:D-3-phosphoglycerate dehydrogenase / 2-oxoglutarate reductase